MTANDELMMAISTNDQAKFESVLKKDPKQANINLNQIKETPLTLAALNGRSKMVEILLKDGAQINHQTTNGWTALMFAARGSCFQNTCDGMHETNDLVETVKVLVKHGADQNLKNSDDMTAWLLATRSNNTKILKLLKKPSP